jgi:hypothetical protein
VSSLSRSDLYRIVFPGAIAAILAVYVLRVIALTPPETPVVQHYSALVAGGYQFIEDPLRGLAAAFAVGFVLYFLDPGYSTGAYRKNLPSDKVQEVAADYGYSDVDRRDVYFLLFNEHMPADLRERSLLYGAFFRIGFLGIILTHIASSALVVGILFYSTSQSELASLSDMSGPTAVAVGWGSVTAGIGAVWVGRRWRTRRPEHHPSTGWLLNSGRFGVNCRCRGS